MRQHSSDLNHQRAECKKKKKLTYGRYVRCEYASPCHVLSKALTQRASDGHDREGVNSGYKELQPCCANHTDAQTQIAMRPSIATPHLIGWRWAQGS